MTGLFVVCISILVSTGSAAPQSRLLSAERTVERMSRGVQPRDDRVSLIGNWDYPASTALLDEFMIDSSITRVGAIGDQTEPAGAFGVGTYLVVWRDAWRDDIYGARLDTNGLVLDSSGIPICTVAGGQRLPAVAFDGVNYLVTWADYRNSPSESDIYGARVSASGDLLEPLGTAISVSPGSQHSPAVAFDGVNYLVVWSDGRNLSADIYGARVDMTGNVLDSLGIAISCDLSYEDYPTVAFCQDKFLAVWCQGADIYAARVDASGAVLDSSGFAVSAFPGNESYPSASSDGTKYFVVWSDGRSGIDSDIYGARVDTSGSVLDPSGIAICTEAGSQSSPSVGFNGTNYLALWKGGMNGINAARVDTSGNVLDPSAIVVCARGMFPSLALDGPDHLALWQDYASMDSDVRGAMIDTSGLVLDTTGVLITIGPNLQYSPLLSFDGSNYLAVWSDDRDGTTDNIYGSRVTGSGTVLDSCGARIFSAPDRHIIVPVSVSFNGTNHLVVWWDGDIVEWTTFFYGSRVSPSGEVLDSSGIAICTTDYERHSSSAASCGGGWLVVWDEYRSGEYTICGARVDSSGTALDPSPITILTSSQDLREASVASDGSNYFVVWSGVRGVTDYDICGTRVDTSGTVLDPSGIVISNRPEREGRPSIAFDGTNYFIVWTIDRTSTSLDIHGARVSTGGTVLDPSGIAISTATDDQDYPSLVFHGSGYLAVWQDFRSHSVWDIYGARVSISGTVLDPSGLELANQPYGRQEPALSSGFGGHVLLGYDKLVPEPYNTIRVLGALFENVGIEEECSRPCSKGTTSALYQNAPNPFRTHTVVKYELSTPGEVTLEIYDIAGRLVETLVNDVRQPGTHQVRWDRGNNSCGVCFCRLRAGDRIEIRKMVIVD